MAIYKSKQAKKQKTRNNVDNSSNRIVNDDSNETENELHSVVEKSK